MIARETIDSTAAVTRTVKPWAVVLAGLDGGIFDVHSLLHNVYDHPVAASDSPFENAPSATRRASLCYPIL